MSVSTAAAEMKIEEADIALANTLDALMASGASAGGATALAQAALQSKKGVAASIEKQEAENERLRAGGEERLQQLELKEGQRVQQVQIQEGRRMQQGEMMGRKYKFDAQEKRDVRKMNFLRGEYKTAKGREYGASMAKASAIGDIASGLGGIADSAFGNPFAAKTPPGAGSATSGLQNYTPMATPTVSIPDYDLSISDRKLKKNIKLIGYSPSGLKIYVFEYINKAFGKGIFQGVMSDEIPQIAVIKHSDGYDKVDYSKIDVDFKQI